MNDVRHISGAAIVVADEVEVKTVWETKCLLGEGPHWDRSANTLFFLDIKGRAIHVLPLDDPNQGREKFSTPNILTSIVQDREGGLLGTSEHGVVRVDLPTKTDGMVELTPVASIEKSSANIRFNDGKAGPQGTYWAGLMDDTESGEPLGSLFRFTSVSETSRVKADIIVPNGPAFCASGKFVYFADSARAIIYRAEILSETETTEPRPYIQFDEGLGYPDGMTCDAEDNLWVAFWDGGCVRRFSADLKQVTQFDLPALRPTSMAITPGRLYVTSASVDLSDQQLATYPLSGSLFSIDIAGLEPGPDYRVRGFDT